MLVKKSNNQVLVKKAVRAVYPVSGGGPVMMLGGGGGGGGPRGKTLRERAGGFLGGVVGVAGALTGSHRSIGGLSNAMVSGGATGSQLGSAFGRKFVGRRGQEIANLREAQKRENARLAAAHKEEFGASGFRDKPIADQRRTYLRGVAVRQAEDKQRAKEEQMAREAHARAYGGKMGEEDKAFNAAARAIYEGVQGGGFRGSPEEFAGQSTMFRDATRVDVPQSDPVQEATNRMQELPFTQKVTPPSDPELTAAGELNQQVRPEDVDADTEGEVSDNEYPAPSTPEGEASKLDPKNVTPEQRRNIERSLSGQVKVE